MKPFEYYSKPQTLYPDKKNYITFFVYDRGEVVTVTPAFEKSKKDLMNEYPNAVIQEFLDEDAYKAHRKEYNDERAKLQQEFKDDLFAQFNVTDNPKRFKCFELAWDKGHAYGHSEVYSYFSDFVELIYD
jgi:hypothetical protein